MRKIDGTATISIEEFDELREHEKWFNELRSNVRGLVEKIDTEQYDREMKKIDDMGDVTDEEIDRLVKKAAGTLKITVSDKIIRKLIREYIDEEKSDVHYAVSEMTNKELEQIPLFLDGGQQDFQKIIKEKDKEIRRLKKQVGDLKNEMSYMHNPLAISDRHEMGG